MEDDQGTPCLKP